MSNIFPPKQAAWFVKELHKILMLSVNYNLSAFLRFPGFVTVYKAFYF